MHDDLADSGAPSPYTAAAATRAIVALAQESNNSGFSSASSY